MFRYHTLSEAERRIIVDKSTEPPGSGEYNKRCMPGVFACRRCDLPLYLSENKFESHCGWPSFDEELANAVLRLPDRDGRRTEIVCRRCSAHLGHVFDNEGLTQKNVRHCVNSLSLFFVPAYTDEGYERAFFAGGCFWGVEHAFSGQRGVVSTRVGYMGGHLVSPSYEEVCSGLTGHAETVEVCFDPAIVDYEKIAQLFFEIHDPEQKLGQGPDIGPQYRSILFYLASAQRSAGLFLVRQLTQKGFDIASEIVPGSRFYPAEEHHQQYYKRRGQEPYCHKRVFRF